MGLRTKTRPMVALSYFASRVRGAGVFPPRPLAHEVHSTPSGRAAASRRSIMRAGRAFLFGVLGAGAISATSVVLRTIGVPIRLELILGTAFGTAPGPAAFALGLAMHLAIGGAFGLL